MYAGSGSGAGSEAGPDSDFDCVWEGERDAMVRPEFKPLGSREETPREGSWCL